MKEDKEKGGEYSPYPPPGTKLGKPQHSKRVSMVLFVEVSVKKIFEEGKDFPWPRPPTCPRCQGRIWGHGFVRAFFDGFPRALLLRRYRCADCGLTLRLRPKGYWPRFQASIQAIRDSLSHRLRFYHWPSGVSRQRGGHWLRSLIRQARWWLGVGWKGGLLRAFEKLYQKGVIPVSRSIESSCSCSFGRTYRRVSLA